MCFVRDFGGCDIQSYICATSPLLLDFQVVFFIEYYNFLEIFYPYNFDFVRLHHFSLTGVWDPESIYNQILF